MKIFLGIFLLALTFGVVGCRSTEPENLSERPWNSPNGWESGLPSGMMQNQR
ncbi:MAG: hypothetical protein RL380_1786 [Verrucomicrobiota bacterium]